MSAILDARFIAQRLHGLAAEMRLVADLMADYSSPDHHRQHADELRGAAKVATGWADGFLAEAGKA